MFGTILCILALLKIPSVSHKKYIETETINPKSLADFKNCINKANVITQFNLNPLGDLNNNYDI